MAFENAPRAWMNGVTVDTQDIDAGAVTVEKIASDTITAAVIADGSLTPALIGLPYRNETGGALAAGDLLYVSGWDEVEGLPLVSKADADVAGARAEWIAQEATADTTNSVLPAVKRYRLTAVNTSAASAAGDPVYLSTTAGGWTLTAPTGADDTQQVVGYVHLDDAAGAIEFNLLAGRFLKCVGTNELQDLGVTGAKVAANTITTDKLATNTIQYAAVQLTNSQIKNMRAAPVQLVAAQGANTIIVFHKAKLVLDAGANVLTEAGDNMAIKYTNGAGIAVSQTIESTGFIDAADDIATNAEPVINAIATEAECENQVLCIHNIGGAEFAGNAANDALLYVHVWYSVINSNV